MKTNQITRRFAVAVLTAAASLASMADLAKAQPSPVGEWDFVITGKHRGNARITFFSDFTLVGFQINTLAPVKTPSVNPRTGEIEGGTIVGSGGFFGSSVISGVWSFDVIGRTIGSYVTESTIIEDGTNKVVSTALSFRAAVNPQRTTAAGALVGSMILNAQGPGQSVQLRGRPTIPLVNLSGSYYGVSTRDGINFQEFFSLSPTALPNMYDVVGTGPDYSYSGVALLTRTGQFSMATERGGTNAVITSLTGVLRTSTFPPQGLLTGQQDDVRTVKFRINQ
jgi:hypothetical protein